MKVNNYGKTNVRTTSDSYIAAKVLINVTAERYCCSVSNRNNPRTTSQSFATAFMHAALVTRSVPLYRLVGIGWKEKFKRICRIFTLIRFILAHSHAAFRYERLLWRKSKNKMKKEKETDYVIFLFVKTLPTVTAD